MGLTNYSTQNTSMFLQVSQAILRKQAPKLVSQGLRKTNSKYWHGVSITYSICGCRWCKRQLCNRRKRSYRQRQTSSNQPLKILLQMPFVGGEGGRGAFSTWFLTYFDSRLQFKAIFYFTSLQYIGNQLQIEIVSYGCPLFPSKIGMQPYRIFCDPFQGFPPPPSPPPSKKRRKIRTLSHKCIQNI